jgi:hypothetical protein
VKTCADGFGPGEDSIPTNEYIAFLEDGVDGMFSDFADTAVVGHAWLRLNQPRTAYAAHGDHPQGRGRDEVRRFRTRSRSRS